ncbi:DNA-directed DNA polymerase alpha subunit pol12 [Savitreella phatthalungensis]
MATLEQVARFGGVSTDVASMLRSINRLYDISDDDLFFKWESWTFKMGNDPQLNVDNVALFKQDIQNQIEFENQARLRAGQSTGGTTPASSRKLGATALASGGFDDFLGSDMTPVKKVKREPLSTAKRAISNAQPISTPSRSGTDYEKPLTSTTPNSQRHGGTNTSLGTPKTPFGDRKEPGTIVQVLNPGSITAEPTSRVVAPALVANFDPKKYGYRPMYQKLSETAEILDEQIDSWADVVLAHLDMAEDELANPARESQQTVLCIGRIVCDSIGGGRLNPQSVLLETSRRLGTGSRTRLDLSQLSSFSLFPGQLVALRGSNAGGAAFRVEEIINVPLLPPSASAPAEFAQSPTTCIVAAGPFTTDSDLLFEPLRQLASVAAQHKPDQIILLGPLLDVSHPMLRSGDFDAPETIKLEDGDDSPCETLDDLFRVLVSPILRGLPGLLIIPHPLDVLTRHPCFPQDALPRSALGMSKTSGARCLPNPALFSLDEASFGACSLDIVKHLALSECSRDPPEKNALARAAAHVLQQRRFFPLYPVPAPTQQAAVTQTVPVATDETDADLAVLADPLGAATSGNAGSAGGLSASIDWGYSGLADFGTRTPDIMLLPSEMSAFARVISGTVVINPGTLAKRRGAGTFAKVVIRPRESTTDTPQDGTLIPHELWNRTRVDIIRI